MPFCAPRAARAEGIVPVDNGGYACASSARGGSGASWAQRIAGGVTAPPLPAAVPAGPGPSSEGPFDLFWRGQPPQLPYGGSTRFMGVQLGGKVIWAGSQGCGCGAGTSGQQQEAVTSLPADGAPRCGCRRPVLACSPIPADATIVSAGQVLGLVTRPGRRRRSPAECRPGRPLSC